MDRHFKSDLRRLLGDYTTNGRGPFGQWAHEQGKFAPALTNRELADGLIRSYGPALMTQLYQAKLAKFYELDVVSVVGVERSRLVLGAAHKWLNDLETNLVETGKETSAKATIGAVALLAALIAALHFLGPKPDGDTRASGAFVAAGYNVGEGGGGRGRD